MLQLYRFDVSPVTLNLVPHSNSYGVAGNCRNMSIAMMVPQNNLICATNGTDRSCGQLRLFPTMLSAILNKDPA